MNAVAAGVDQRLYEGSAGGPGKPIPAVVTSDARGCLEFLFAASMARA
ncbi:MAG: hypothetical protein M3463_03060 [Verrucomicrobiota bacterium]|nr:hypothetical protein [Verrucomicrobiota bacterium]